MSPPSRRYTADYPGRYEEFVLECGEPRAPYTWRIDHQRKRYWPLTPPSDFPIGKQDELYLDLYFRHGGLGFCDLDEANLPATDIDPLYDALEARGARDYRCDMGETRQLQGQRSWP